MLSINSSKKEFVDFTLKVKRNKIPPFVYKETLLKFKKIKVCSEKEAINLINNLSLASYRVSTENLEYQTYIGEVLLHITKFINLKNRSKNFKLLYALYKSQVKENEKDFKLCIDLNLMEYIAIKIKNLDKEDKKHSEHIIIKVLKELMSKDKSGRFNILNIL